MKTLTAYDILNIDGTLYYVCNEFNALVRCENTRRHELISNLPGESIYAQALISQIFYIDRKIVCIPLHAKKIWIFDLANNLWKGIDLDDSECRFKFMKAVRYKNKIYLFPCRYRKMVIFDFVSEKITYIDIHNGLDESDSGTYFRNDFVIKESTVYAAYCSRGYVFRFDMSTEKYEWLKLDLMCDGFSGIAYCQSKFWLLYKNDSNKLCCWNGKEDYKEFNIGNEKLGWSRGISANDKKIYIKNNNETIVVDASNLQVIKKENVSYIYFDSIQAGYEKMASDGDYIWQDKNGTNSVKLQIEDSVRETFIGERITNEDLEYIINMKVVLENKDFYISDYLGLISRKS